MEITCPSGLRGEVRKLKGAEANILSDRKAAKKGENYDRILSACWLRTIDAAPYGFDPEKPPPWGKILVCDRFYALYAMRIATYGPEYCFPVRCSDKFECGSKFEWEINLENDVPIYDLPEETREKIASGQNRFDTEVGGHHYIFKLLTGDDERAAGKEILKHQGEMMTTALKHRIVSVDNELTRPREIEEFLKTELGLDDQWGLLEAFEEVDGGVESRIEIQCPDCDLKFGVTLPFEGEGFWIPTTRKQRNLQRSAKRKSRTRTFGGDQVLDEGDR